jgi:ABC-2 type transport system permease protein
MFWTLGFSLILGTFFNIAFGSIISNTESFSQIPVAVVINSVNGQPFSEMIDSLSQDEDSLLLAHYVDMEQAEKLLTDGDIDGIFYLDENNTVRLITMKSGINQSILKTVSDKFIQISAIVNNIVLTRPDMVAETIQTLSGGIEINKEIYLGRGETNMIAHYFYALIAMACLYGSLLGYTKVAGIQADKSPLAARRSVSTSKKIAMIIVDFSAAVTIQFMSTLILLAYLIFVLGINFGNEWQFIMLTSLTGSIMGVSLGIFIGSFIKGDENKAMGIISSSTLTLCFLSGLMFGDMKKIIEQNIPIINRINPAALLSDAFYSLTVYDTYTTYIRCILSMLVISVIFCILSSFVLRRKKYADI